MVDLWTRHHDLIVGQGLFGGWGCSLRHDARGLTQSWLFQYYLTAERLASLVDQHGQPHSD